MPDGLAPGPKRRTVYPTLTTAASFTIVGGAAPVFLIGGTVEFTVHRATLTVQVSGSFDVSTGNFIVSGPIASATGKLAGATGTVMLDGVEDFATGKFTKEISGLLCVDLAP